MPKRNARGRFATVSAAEEKAQRTAAEHAEAARHLQEATQDERALDERRRRMRRPPVTPVSAGAPQQPDIPSTTSTSTPVSTSAPRVEPEPQEYVNGRRVTDADVRQVLANHGRLEDYLAGRMSKADAYRRTRNVLREHDRMMGATIRRSPYRDHS